MPYKRKNSPHYWISYVDPVTGKQSCRSSGSENFAEAKALEQKFRSQAHQDKKQNQTDSRITAVLAHYLNQNLNARNQSICKNLLSLADRWASELDSKSIRNYIKTRTESGAKPATVNRELVVLSAAINAWNLDHSTQLKNPVNGLKLKESEHRLRWLTRDEYDRLIDSSDGYLRDFIILAVQTGMRRGELLNLTWDRVDFANATIRLEAGQTKTGKSRTIPLNADAIKALKRRAADCQTAWVFCSDRVDGPISEIKRGFKTACAQAGIENATPHTLRHTTASWLVMSGTPIYDVAKLLGHSSISTTQRYAHLAPDHLRATVAALESASNL